MPTKICIKSLMPDVVLCASGRLKKKWLQMERDKAQIDFLNGCLEEKVLPKHLMESIPKSKRHPSIFGDKHATILLNAITERVESSTATQSEFNDELKRLSVTKDKEKYFKTLLIHFVKREKLQIVKKNREQLFSLCLNKKAKTKQNELEIKPVINLSTRKISKSEQETLRFGFNMTWPNVINTNNVKVELEHLYNRIEKIPGITQNSLDEINTQLKVHYYNIDRHKKNALPTKIKQHIKNLNNLRKDKSIYISRFDKGNGVCLDVKERYVHKINTILSDKTKFSEYKQDKRVKIDSFIYAEEKFNRTIKDLFKKHSLPKEILSKIVSTGSTPARLYGIPKIHKDVNNPPYRPVLSMVNAYPSNLAKYLDNILKPFIPRDRTCTDSFDFKQKLLNAHLPPNSYIVSYDVVSLFTNVPVKETVNYILELIPENQLPLPKSILRTLLLLATTNILFSFDDKLYLQEEGVCMGSNLGPTMASFALSMIEDKFNDTPIFYQRYVDDIFAVFHSKDEAETFLQHINTFHPNLKFTIEHPKDNRLTFLDITINVDNSRVETKWYMKKTNTGIYLPKIAYSPMKYKTAAIRALISRAYKLSSSNENFTESYKTIQLVFINNGFHYKFIDKIKDKILSSLNNTDDKEDNEQQYIYYKLPYIKELEKTNRNIFRQINSKFDNKAQIRLAYQTTKTSSFFPNKDKVTDNAKSSLVYQYKCSHCGGCYTGETIRHLSTRINEHLTGRPMPTEVTTHVHEPQRKDFTIALRTAHTKIGEAIVIKEIDADKRINANRPCFQPKLF